ncbi:FAD-dependent oxidoreductase [Humitalea sp. 24SJ18S-53]|uniref:FAD-dependent oxidoreductase n=1 Tax=Humitalea sp. 24SJ18S-53 TaxID=3422307 RepID=UPI003D6693C1
MTARLLPAAGFCPTAHVPVVIIGAGAAGLCAALAAQEAGAEPLVIERDPVPQGSTSLSAGLIPAAGTRFQAARGIADAPAHFAADIQKKAHDRADPAVVAAVSENAAPAIEWLADRHGLAFSVVHDFDYPGHSARRMHGLPSRSGAELVDRLRAAAERAGVAILTEALAETLVADTDGRIRGVIARRPDGSEEAIGCDALVLACCGYGGDPALVARYIPSLAKAVYFGHPGNTGDAVRWGDALGAGLRDMTGHQGHGSVAHPAAILITWAVITEGGFQVNTAGDRFWDESQGYSESAEAVLSQPDGIAFDIFDARIAAIARQFEDFRSAEAAGAIVTADTPEALAARLNLPGLPATMASVDAGKAQGATDAFGRDWSGRAPLVPPFHAVRVTGTLFHTQGGLAVDASARVLRPDGSAFPNLFAAGGAACGVSGPEAGGYLSGNGLLTAVVLGRLAGQGAAG